MILSTTLRRLACCASVVLSLASSAQTFQAGWPSTDDVVFAVAHDPTTNTVFIGGIFNTVGGQQRSSIASINTVTGALTSWNPGINGEVYAFAISGSTLYVGGDFDTAAGASRDNLAAFDIPSGNLLTWGPDVNGTVEALAVSGTTLYLSGDFSVIQGVVRNKIGAVPTTGIGTPTAWDAGYISDWVRTISVSGSTVYVGGWFGSIDGTTRSYIAALGTGTGNVLSWDPSAGDRVKTVLADGNNVYAAGSFYSIGGASRTGVAAVDATTGMATAWDAGLNDFALSIARAGNFVYVGGAFTNAGGQSRNGLAAIDKTTGLATAWDPALADGPNDIYIYSLVVSGGKIYAAGDFSTVGGTGHPNFAVWTGAPTGVEENAHMAELLMGPNPCTGVLQLHFAEPGASTVEIHDLSGARVHTLPFHSTIDLTDVAAGIYCLTVVDRSGTAMARARLVRD